MRACSTGVFEVLSPAVRIKKTCTIRCGGRIIAPRTFDSEHESSLLKNLAGAKGE